MVFKKKLDLKLALDDFLNRSFTVLKLALDGFLYRSWTCFFYTGVGRFFSKQELNGFLKQ